MVADIKDFFVILFQFYTGPTIVVLTPLALCTVITFLYFKMFFRNVEGFKNDVENAGRIPFYNKDYNFAESLWSFEKINFWIFISLICSSMAYPQAAVWFPHWFNQ
jgi:hypothetical protein